MTKTVFLRRQESRAAERRACGPGLLPAQEHEGSFAAAASRLAGLAGALLGWRPHEFWSATPAELAAVLAALAGQEEGGAASAEDVSRLMEQFPDG